ncbi:MAG: hypothetical protein H0U31_04585 [Chloroflexia bacterium]|nr:hypothetical protein [Chloroflexia bacterium]
MVSPGASTAEEPVGFNRRRFVATCVGSAVLGASWFTGLALLARGRHPQMFVVGDDAWQVLLVEHGDCRIVILNGDFEHSPEPEVNRLCSVLRQRLDVVAGTGKALALLSNDFRARRAVDTMIQLDGLPGQASSPNYVPLTRSIEIAIGDIRVQFRPLPQSQAEPDHDATNSWIAHIQVGEMVAAIAPSLDPIADHASMESSLAIAVTGALDDVPEFLLERAIAINAQWATHATDNQMSNGVYRTRSTLVRVFPRDIAAFVFRGERLTLPDWAQSIGDESA